jgi:gas vesicle protein
LAAGFLFAPAKGKKTRKKISSKANELKEDIKVNMDSEKIRGLANSAATEFEKYGQKITEAIKN